MMFITVNSTQSLQQGRMKRPQTVPRGKMLQLIDLNKDHFVFADDFLAEPVHMFGHFVNDPTICEMARRTPKPGPTTITTVLEVMIAAVDRALNEHEHRDNPSVIMHAVGASLLERFNAAYFQTVQIAIDYPHHTSDMQSLYAVKRLLNQRTLFTRNLLEADLRKVLALLLSKQYMCEQQNDITIQYNREKDLYYARLQRGTKRILHDRDTEFAYGNPTATTSYNDRMKDFGNEYRVRYDIFD
jgi:hypothetical protein